MVPSIGHEKATLFGSDENVQKEIVVMLEKF